MSQRFGGRYSPDGSPTGPKDAPLLVKLHPVGARVNLLFVLPFAFALGAFFKDPAGLALNLGAFGLLMVAAWLTREGVIAQAAYDERRVARRPAIPRKIFGSMLTGMGLGLAAGGIMPGVILGGVGGILHLIAFGPDPLGDKGMEGVDLMQTDRAARAIADAERLLSEMESAIARAGDQRLVRRVAGFAAQIRPLFRTIEDDPRHLNAARRYLGVYLQGARDATVKFADLYARTRDVQALSDYEALLGDLEGRFSERRAALLSDDRTALDIEIEVLRERLDREGLRPADPRA
ncbi:MAG: 5-bromo-4-chloroindolyl phosphate hydrolysis family protein [Roseinatronobacter sp.]